MSLINPTQLRIGATGTIDGVEYRVMGRLVMSVFDGGDNYYWNEFNLEATYGGVATLVYEETQRGGEWRFFILFDPEMPLSIADARALRLGDRLNLDGTEVRINFKGRSCVRRTEGKVPQGEVCGAMEEYLNAVAGDKMVVLSWVGKRMECYHGYTFARGVAEQLFRIPIAPPSDYAKSLYSSGSYLTMQNFLFICIALFGLLLFMPTCNRLVSRPHEVKVFSSQPSLLKMGSAGNLNGRNYHITAHNLVEIAETGWRWERHEYPLTDDDGHSALLVAGEKPGSKRWWLFTIADPSLPMTPEQAGNVLLGQSVTADNLNIKVQDLFISTERPAGDSPSPDWVDLNSTTHYGFAGSSGGEMVMARWNKHGISIYRGTQLSTRDVMDRFKQ